MTRSAVLLLAAALAAAPVALADPPPRAGPAAAPGAVPAAPAAPPAPAAPLRFGDELAVKVLDHPDLSGNIRIAADGTVDVPFVGRIRAIGRTLADIAADVRAALAKGQIRDPQVSVTIHALAPNVFSVLGAVTLEGTFEVPREERVHVLRALAAAKGFKPEADPSQVQIISAAGEIRAVDARLGNAPSLARIVVEHGATIVVPETAKIYVTGQVNRPGGFTPTSGEGMTLMKVISLAGGPTRLARTGAVQVIYPGGPGGAEQTRVFDLDQIAANRSPDPPIYPGCRIVVPERLF
jgi:polysaccharide export outer membrane protein